MPESFSARMQKFHERLKRDAAGVNLKYILLLGIRIVMALLGKPLVYRCYQAIQYFRREDLLVWYLFYWMLFCGTLIKRRFARFF